jgi:DNA polymerase III delta prime subunit
LKFVVYIYVTCVVTGICIAQRESSLNTAAINRANSDGSVDNGIFQVSSRLFYNKKKSLVSIEKTPHAWSMDCRQKAKTDQLLSKFVAL